jgi:hypothetical protein
VVAALRHTDPYRCRWGDYEEGTLQNLLTDARDPKQAPFPWLLQENANWEAARDMLDEISRHDKSQSTSYDTFLTD